MTKNEITHRIISFIKLLMRFYLPKGVLENYPQLGISLIWKKNDQGEREMFYVKNDDVSQEPIGDVFTYNLQALNIFPSGSVVPMKIVEYSKGYPLWLAAHFQTLFGKTKKYCLVDNRGFYQRNNTASLPKLPPFLAIMVVSFDEGKFSMYGGDVEWFLTRNRDNPCIVAWDGGSLLMWSIDGVDSVEVREDNVDDDF